MKNFTGFILIFLISLCQPFSASAQQYLGAGIRMSPDGLGFTGKIFINKKIAFEAQLNAGGLFAEEGKSFNAVSMFQYHLPLMDPSWRVFFGGGFYSGVWNHDHGFIYREENFRKKKYEGILGICGIGGVEHFFKNGPLAFSLDFKPSVNVLSNVDFFSHNLFGLSLRYYLR